MDESTVTKWIINWIAGNSSRTISALYGLCVELADDLYTFLEQNGESPELWELWDVNDDIMELNLPTEVSVDAFNKEMENLRHVYKPWAGGRVPLCDIGNAAHHFVKWNGSYWDGKGKRNTAQEIINDFNRDNHNIKFFRTQ